MREREGERERGGSSYCTCKWCTQMKTRLTLSSFLRFLILRTTPCSSGFTSANSRLSSSSLWDSSLEKEGRRGKERGERGERRGRGGRKIDEV